MARRIFVACTGAGAGAQQEIWRVPGCSEYFAGAAFPYARDQLVDFLGFEPEQFCSLDTALHMAMAAYYRAWVPGADAVGVGLCAAVASAKPRRGKNRIHAAVMTAKRVQRLEYEMESTHGSACRKVEGELADKIVSSLIADYDSVTDNTARATELFLSRPYWSRAGTRHAAPPPARPLFPGAFNPPHEGHLQIADDQGAIFWVEASAPHKPSLELADLVQRAKRLHGHDRFFTNGCPLYLDKSIAFPDRPFIIGADAFLRMLDPKWGPNPIALLNQLEENGTVLRIVGRKVGDRFVSSEEAIAAVPESGTRLGLQALVGRWDVSSTEMRENANC